MSDVNMNNRWWERLFKVLHIAWLILITFGISAAMIGESSNGLLEHETLFSISAILFGTYIITEIVIRTFYYVFQGKKFLEIKMTKLQKALFLISIALSVLGLIFIPIDNYKENASMIANKKTLFENYQKALSEVKSLNDRFEKCISPILEKKIAEEIRSCNLYKNKVKSDYNFCVSFISINSPDSCLYENDYKKIDCSNEKIREKVSSKMMGVDMPKECAFWSNTIKRNDATIEKYERDVELMSSFD